MVVILVLLAWMIQRALVNKEEWDDRLLVFDANVYVSLWYIIVITGGLMPPLILRSFSGQWCAPPFNYPPTGAHIIALHVIPAVTWLVTSGAMVFFTTLEDFSLHRTFGMAGMQSIFLTFELSALYSMVSNLSPLGRHVQTMETLLAAATWLYFVIGMYYIAQFEPEYHTGHKISMVTTMITASGPGFFRVLRHTRELLSGRLCKPTRYTNYADVPDNAENWYNFKSVESTYFCLAFLITDAFVIWVYHQMGMLSDPRWGSLCIFYGVLPILGVVMPILYRFVPGHHPDFDWTFSLNYNFPVLTGEPKSDAEVQLSG